MKSHRVVSRASRRARLGLTLLLALAVGGADGRQAAVEPALDPLTMPRPALDEPLILPADNRLPAQKIVATMPFALRGLEDPSSARVIVTLHEPLSTGAAARSRAEKARAQGRRLARIANVEHDFAEAASRLGFRATSALSHFAIVVGEISPERLAYLAALPQVSAIEPDRVLRASTVEGKALINSDDLANNFGGDGEGVVVAVIDSGIDDSHPELAGKVPVHRTYNGPLGDVLNHGTKVAGIIAGDHGAAPQATLWDIKVIHDTENTTIAILLNALNALMPDIDDIDILVGAFSDPSLRFNSACDALNPSAADVVNTFRDAGKLLIGSSGNEGDATGLGIPACLEAILATGSVYDANLGSRTFFGCTDNTTAADKIACYSNGGPLVDFYAPGHCARTAKAGGGFDDCFGGTSASAAYVGGVAAQIWSLLPNVSAADLANALKTHGPNLNDSRSGISRRRIDALASFQALGGGAATPTPTRTATPTQQGPGPSPTPSRTPTPTKTPSVAPGGTPAAPSGLTAQALTHTAVLLQWSDHSNNETSFRIEARTGAATFQEVGTSAANVSYFTAEDLMPSKTYDFRVRARNASVNSPYSNVASATTAAATAACVQNANTACLLGSKFRITGEMKNFKNPPVTFQNQVMSFQGGRAESDQAVFFESFSAGNFEVGVKMVDACSLAPGNPVRNYWVFAGALTNAKADITLQDTVTGATFTWHNPAGQFPTSIGNTMAFPCANPGGTPSCVRDATTACLINGRFRVTGTMQNFANPPKTFTTKVINFAQSRAETEQAVFFQSFNPGNFEIGVKMVDACSLSPGDPLRHYWIFYGGLTTADSEVRAVQIATGDVDLWRNPSGTSPTTEGRTMAFDCP